MTYAILKFMLLLVVLVIFHWLDRLNSQTIQGMFLALIYIEVCLISDVVRRRL